MPFLCDCHFQKYNIHTYVMEKKDIGMDDLVPLDHHVSYVNRLYTMEHYTYEHTSLQ
jgi:hypothetical protein